MAWLAALYAIPCAAEHRDFVESQPATGKQSLSGRQNLYVSLPANASNNKMLSGNLSDRLAESVSCACQASIGISSWCRSPFTVCSLTC